VTIIAAFGTFELAKEYKCFAGLQPAYFEIMPYLGLHIIYYNERKHWEMELE
jgi:hypothetical protein